MKAFLFFTLLIFALINCSKMDDLTENQGFEDERQTEVNSDDDNSSGVEDDHSEKGNRDHYHEDDSDDGIGERSAHPLEDRSAKSNEARNLRQRNEFENRGGLDVPAPTPPTASPTNGCTRGSFMAKPIVWAFAIVIPGAIQLLS
ncbi:hypothetical protein ACOME3_005959 [Neoechinorhynchus agilis]